jgi:ribonuclease P/MRP protein subunit RPP1
MREYVDLGVHPFPEGADTPNRLSLVARRLGFSDIIATVHSPYWSESPALSSSKGVEIVASTVRDLRKKIAFFRDVSMIVSVHGGDERINRAACRDDRVDVLMHPERGKRNGLNQITAKLAKKNGVALGLCLDYFWKTEELERSRLLSFQRKNVVLCRKFGVRVVLTSNAYSHFDLRVPRQLKSLARLVQLSDEDSEIALSDTPLYIVRRRQERKEAI